MVKNHLKRNGGINTYKGYDFIDAQAPRLYREPSEIKRDISEVAERIGEINEMLNARRIISEVISEQSAEDYERKTEAITEICEFASEALSEMAELERALEELRIELIDSVRAVS